MLAGLCFALRKSLTGTRIMESPALLVHRVAISRIARHLLLKTLFHRVSASSYSSGEHGILSPAVAGRNQRPSYLRSARLKNPHTPGRRPRSRLAVPALA